MKTVFGAVIAMVLVLAQAALADPPKSDTPAKPSADHKQAPLGRAEISRLLLNAISQLQPFMKPMEEYKDRTPYNSPAAMDLKTCRTALAIAKMVPPEDAAKFRQKAAKILQYIVKDYPNSLEAKEAAELLKGLNKKP